MDKEHILSEIRRTAAANDGHPLGTARFEAVTGIKLADWYGKHWARWGDALLDAGYSPNQMREAYDDDLVLGKLADLIREIGHFPVRGELSIKARSDKNFPSHNVFRRVGRKSELVAKLLDWCERQAGYGDVSVICQKLKDETVPDVESDTESSIESDEIGFVYLFKSGKHYKIGRSNSSGRREYELAIQLPEKLIKVHEISTDDPIGIEKYWHSRFADRRKNGEWFELTPADVRAFKRRKFM